jgi:uncharacterized protein YjbJ (UPF0337 family)
MSTQQRIIGNWGQLKGRVKERWGQLTDDELQEVEGNFDQLLALIQQKTGEAREQIEHTLSELNKPVKDAIPGTAKTVRQYADRASEAVRGAAEQVGDTAVVRYEEAQEMVRQHPREAIAVAFGVGVGVGLLIALSFQSSQSRPRGWRDRMMAEGIGRRLLERAESILPEALSERMGL